MPKIADIAHLPLEEKSDTPKAAAPLRSDYYNDGLTVCAGLSRADAVLGFDIRIEQAQAILSLIAYSTPTAHQNLESAAYAAQCLLEQAQMFAGAAFSAGKEVGA